MHLKPRPSLRALAATFFVLITIACAAAHAESVNDAIEVRGPIFTYLLDTGTPSAAALTNEAVSTKESWTLLDEEDLTHEFAGDTVLLNDRLVVVLRKNGHGAEVYPIRDASNPKPYFRGRLRVVASGGNAATRLDAIEIVENDPGAVSVRVTFATEDDKALDVAFRLTTGQIQIQVEPGEVVDAVRLDMPTEYLVVPDFFGDDLVYDAQSSDNASAGLPAENFALHLLEGGGIATAVWETTGRNTRVLFEGDGTARRIAGTEIECVPTKMLWAAFAEPGPAWYARTISPEETKEDLSLDWKPPFPAKWRANFVAGSEVSMSWNFGEARQAHFKTPGIGDLVYPCWFEEETPFLHPPSQGVRRAVVYPIDRTQATPLNVFVLVDVMRSTLGVGPCQYILDIEGMDAQTTPTPALVCEWIESQLKKKRSRVTPEDVRERIDAMVQHVEHAEQRIEAYHHLATSIQADCAQMPGPEAEAIQSLALEIDAAIGGLAEARQTPKATAQLADRVAALPGTDDWEAGFKPLHEELSAIGAAQDRTLAKCRMTVRRIRQACLDASDDGLSKAVLEKISAMLEKG